MRIAAFVCSFLLLACSDSSNPADGSVVNDGQVSFEDTSVPMDASDANVADASDASDSALPDASDSSTCTCSSGACCDGCNFRPNTHVCSVTEPFPRACDHTSTWCGGRALTLIVPQSTKYCSGSASACTGATLDTSYNVNCSEPTPGDFQQYGVCMPAEGQLPARCALSCGN